MPSTGRSEFSLVGAMPELVSTTPELEAVEAKRQGNAVYEQDKPA